MDVQNLINLYDFYFFDFADKRVENWFLMRDIFSPITVIILYLLAIYHVLPNYMQNRKPYNLRWILMIYNVIQIISCIWLIYGIATSGWTTHLTLGCEPVDYSDNPMSVRMLNYVWWTMMLKMLEMIETCFFVLRKKFNQITKLHVYHHSSTFFLAWIGTKYFGGGMSTFPIMVNSFVHILMYSYYFLAAMGPDIGRKIAPVKPKLTMLQMIQFCILISHGLQVLSPSCPINSAALLWYIPNIALIFGLFMNFYKQSYMKKQKAYKSS